MKPKRKRLDTRAAGLRQAARLCEREWRGRMCNGPFLRGWIELAEILTGKLERLAREEEKRGE